MVRYKTSEHATILHKGNLLPPNTVLTKLIQKDIPQKTLDEKVQNGSLVVVGDNDPDVGLVDSVDTMPHEIDTTKPAQRKDLRPVAQPRSEFGDPTHRNQPVGKWNRDPKTLKGRNLQQLQAMVAEINHEAELPKSVDEAIAMLSADFRA